MQLRCVYVSLKSTVMLKSESSVYAGLLQEKAVQITGADSPVALEKIGVSVVCKKGYKPTCPNNDGFFVSQ